MTSVSESQTMADALKSGPRPLLTLKEVAGLLRVSEKTVQRRIANGQLPVIRDGGMVRIHPDDLDTTSRAGAGPALNDP